MMTSAIKPEQKRLGGSAQLGADQTESPAKPVAETRNRAQIGRHMPKNRQSLPKSVDRSAKLLQRRTKGVLLGECRISCSHIVSNFCQRSLSLIELQSHHKVEAGSDRNFGLVFCAVFAIIALLPQFSGGSPRIWALVVAAAFAITAFAFPSMLSRPNQLWTKFGILLGSIIAPIIMIFVFFVAVTPMALIMRMTGRDLLRLKLEPSSSSYWIERTTPVGPMNKQF